VGLEPHLDKYLKALSGGHAAAARAGGGDRAQAARALLDEPFGALDPGTLTHMHELVRPLWREHGMTVLMVTHDLKEGFALGTRLVVFDRPRIEPQAPERFGAIITYDLDLTRDSAVPGLGLSKSPKERGNEMQNKEAAI
jgi:NitT/TauT family transport system ATP-binding protein